MRFAVLASDIALFTLKGNELFVRIIHVERPPHFPDNPALPGGILEVTETAEDAARRHVQTKAGIEPKKVHLEQLYTFSGVDRDRRNRVVAVAYIGLVRWEELSKDEQKDTQDAYWLPVTKAKRLAYDHDEILRVALGRLQSKVRYTTLIQKLISQEFTLTELEQVYEQVLNTALDKRNFRKKILKLDVLSPIEGKRTEGKFRPAQLYRFSSKEVQEVSML